MISCLILSDCIFLGVLYDVQAWNAILIIIMNIAALLISLIFLRNPLFELARTDPYHPDTLEVDLNVIDSWKKLYRHPLVLRDSHENTPQLSEKKNKSFKIEHQNHRIDIELESKIDLSSHTIKPFT